MWVLNFEIKFLSNGEKSVLLSSFLSFLKKKSNKSLSVECSIICAALVKRMMAAGWAGWAAGAGRLSCRSLGRPFAKLLERAGYVWWSAERSECFLRGGKHILKNTSKRDCNFDFFLTGLLPWRCCSGHFLGPTCTFLLQPTTCRRCFTYFILFYRDAQIPIPVSVLYSYNMCWCHNTNTSCTCVTIVLNLRLS